MCILVDKDYVDTMFKMLKDKTTAAANAVDTIYIANARPGNAARSRNTGDFSYLCASDLRANVFVRSYAGHNFKFAFAGNLKHGSTNSYDTSTMIVPSFIYYNDGNYFGTALFIATMDSGKAIEDHQSMIGFGNGDTAFGNIMGDAEGHHASVLSIEISGGDLITDDDGNKIMQLNLINADNVSGEFNVSIVVEDKGAFEGSLSIDSIEGVEFTYGDFTLNSEGVNTAAVTIIATDKVETTNGIMTTDVWVMADTESDVFTLTVTKPYATNIELLKDSTELKELELVLDENGKASATFTVKVSMDTTNAIYRDSLTFTEIDDVEFNYSTPFTSNEIEVTINATKAVDNKEVIVTAQGENGTITASFTLTISEYDGGGGLTDPIIPTSDYPFYDFYIWDLCSPSNEDVLEEYHLEINFGNHTFYAGVTSTIGIRAVAGYKITNIHIWQSWWDEVEGPSTLYSDISYTQDGDYFTFKPNYAGLGWSDSTTNPYLHIDITVEEE